MTGGDDETVAPLEAPIAADPESATAGVGGSHGKTSSVAAAVVGGLILVGGGGYLLYQNMGASTAPPVHEAEKPPAPAPVQEEEKPPAPAPVQQAAKPPGSLVQEAAKPPVPPVKPLEPSRPLPKLEEVRAKVAGAASGLKCAMAAVTAKDGGFAVTGYAGTAADAASLKQNLTALALPGLVGIDLAVHPTPFCDVLGIVAPVANETRPTTERVGLWLNQSSRVYRDGEVLKVIVGAPGASGGHLTVDYYDLEGTVVHMVPMPLRRNDRIAAGQSVTLGGDAVSATSVERVYQAAAPYGPGMIVAVLSDRPLFVADRPEVESPTTYIPAFRRVLETVVADKGVVAADVTFFETRAK